MIPLTENKKRIDELVEEVLAMDIKGVKKYLAAYWEDKEYLKGNAEESQKSWVFSKNFDFMEQNGVPFRTKKGEERVKAMREYIKEKFGIVETKK